MVETRLRWFGHVERRHVGSILRVDQMKSGQITRDRGRPRKTIRETIKNLEINELHRDMKYVRTLWRRL